MREQQGPQDATSESGSLAELVQRVPEGWTLARFGDRRYGLSRTTRASGGSISIMARELGGADLVSANIYATASGGARLRSCEMPDRKVLDFLVGWRSEPSSGADATQPESVVVRNDDTYWTN